MENERCREQLIYCYRLLAIIDKGNIGNTPLIIQWGTSSTTTSNSDTKVTFPKAFSSTHYGIALIRSSGSSTTSSNAYWIREIQAGYFKWYNTGYSGVRWVAVGY